MIPVSLLPAGGDNNQLFAASLRGKSGRLISALSAMATFFFKYIGYTPCKYVKYVL